MPMATAPREPRRSPFRPGKLILGARLLLAVAGGIVLGGCGGAIVTTHARPGQIDAVGAENEYANVISQVGGRYVAVTAIERNPNTDPHAFEASPSVARVIAQARLIVKNGLGYDTYMGHVEAATATAGRRVIDVQRLLGLPASTPNPHLWYSPRTMPALARALAGALAALQPAHHAYFQANAQRFIASLRPWNEALARFAARHPHTPVATTEPVGNYLAAAAGARILTPFTLQADIMNGVDPTPQDVSAQEALLSGHRVAVLLYNQQVSDSVTESFLAEARRAGVPVVGVYETMPPGYDYQSWMLAETEALARAVTEHRSSVRLA
jgi:zinc/manganese transport system substrate-binding protein